MWWLTAGILYHPQTEKWEPQETAWRSKEQHEQKNFHFPAKQVSAPSQNQTCSNTSYCGVKPDPSRFTLKEKNRINYQIKMFFDFESTDTKK